MPARLDEGMVSAGAEPEAGGMVTGEANVTRENSVTSGPDVTLKNSVTSERDIPKMSHGSAPSRSHINIGRDLVQKGVTFPAPDLVQKSVTRGLFGRAISVTKKAIGIGAKITPYTSAGLRYWRYRWFIGAKADVSYIAPDQPTDRSERRMTDEQRNNYDNQKRARAGASKRSPAATAKARRDAAAERKRRERARRRDE